MDNETKQVIAVSIAIALVVVTLIIASAWAGVERTRAEVELAKLTAQTK